MSDPRITSRQAPQIRCTIQLPSAPDHFQRPSPRRWGSLCHGCNKPQKPKAPGWLWWLRCHQACQWCLWCLANEACHYVLVPRAWKLSMTKSSVKSNQSTAVMDRISDNLWSWQNKTGLWEAARDSLWSEWTWETPRIVGICKLQPKLESPHSLELKYSSWVGLNHPNLPGSTFYLHLTKESIIE